jgi:RNA polymerase sigma factor (sigma-70 family)
MSDIEIIEHLKGNRNDKVLIVLYKNLPVIKKMITTNGGNSEDAEDIFQEALVVLCMNVKKTDFILTSKLSTYMYSICRFMWKDELKRRNKMVFSYTDTIKDTIDENALTAIQQEEQLKIAESVVKLLGDRCKELLELFYSGKMKLKEIAEKMGYSSENTAKNQKYKCIEAAKKNLKEMNSTISNPYNA